MSTKAKPIPKRKPTATRKRATQAEPAAKPTRAKPKPTTKRKPRANLRTTRKTSGHLLSDSAVAAVKRDLKTMPGQVAASAEAATALAMASRLDSGEGSPSECAKALLQAMAKLREMTPPDTERGQLHAIRSGRADRLAAGSPAGPH